MVLPSDRRLRLVGDPTTPLPPAAPLTLDAVFRAYASYVAAVGLRVLGRDQEVDDLVQEVFLRAARGLSHLREPEAVKAWLATVAVRVGRRRLRARKLRVLLRLDVEHDYQELADPAASPADRALLAEIYRLLDRLPVEQRLAWTLRHVEGEVLGRVALLCGCSLAAAKRRIAAAHRRIQEALGHG